MMRTIVSSWRRNSWLAIFAVQESQVEPAAGGAVITPTQEETFTLDTFGVPVEMSEQGVGPPLLFLHGGYPSAGLDASAMMLAELAKSFRVIAPTHPGFGRPAAPDWLTSVDDLAYLYLDVLRLLDVSEVTLVGESFGGWIAAELCVASTMRISQLILANPLGIKVGDRETRDLVDVFGILDSELAELAFADPRIGFRDAEQLTEDELFHLARSREATARYGWSPYLHDPKLLRRLHRIDVPTLILWGEQDRLTSAAYGSAYAVAISDSVLASVGDAGHFPTVEQPKRCAEHIVAFHRDPVSGLQQ